MKIRWTNHPSNPSLNGTEQHVARSLAEVACGYGQAEIVPPARWGTTEWHAERLAQSAAVTEPGDHDTPAQFFDQPVWSVAALVSGTVCVVKSFKSETTRYEAPPVDCPLSIVEQYLSLKNVDPAAGALALDAAKRAQVEYNASIQNAKRF